MDHLVSVIMPVYGVEKWLETAADSVLAQTERRLELILVDDASPDACPALCDRIQAGDGRVRVIHRAHNDGLSEARNEGLSAARGDLIFFMDSDDAIEPGLLEAAVSALDAHPAEWCVWGVTEEHYDAKGALKIKKEIRPEACYCPDRETMRARIMPLEEQTLLGYAWNKLYRADFLRRGGLRFQTAPLIEDILFNIDCARAASSLVVIAECGYHYARRAQGSLTGRILPYYYEMSARRVSLLLALHEEWGLADERVLRSLAAIYGRYLLSALERNSALESGPARREWLEAVYAGEPCRRLAPYMGGLTGRLVRGRHTRLLLAAGTLLRVMRTRLSGLFMRLRAATR